MPGVTPADLLIANMAAGHCSSHVCLSRGRRLDSNKFSHVSCWHCGSILVSYTRGSCMAGSNPFTVMTNIFVIEFNEFSENI